MQHPKKTLKEAEDELQDRNKEVDKQRQVLEQKRQNKVYKVGECVHKFKL